MLLSATDQDVIEAAEALGEELATVQEETTPLEFDSIIVQCNERISERTGIDYGSACGADGSC